MDTYVILSSLSSDAVVDPEELPRLAATVKEKIREECPNVKWINSYATLGYFDVIDVVESPTQEDIEKVSMIIRCYGHATTQTLPATPWKVFLDNLVHHTGKMYV